MVFIGRIYKIINSKNDKIYIGSTKRSLQIRFDRHISKSYKGNTKIAKAMREIGVENFILILIKEYQCNNSQELNKFKNIQINEYNSIEDGYNQ